MMEWEWFWEWDWWFRVRFFGMDDDEVMEGWWFRG